LALAVRAARSSALNRPGLRIHLKVVSTAGVFHVAGTGAAGDPATPGRGLRPKAFAYRECIGPIRPFRHAAPASRYHPAPLCAYGRAIRRAAARSNPDPTTGTGEHCRP